MGGFQDVIRNIAGFGHAEIAVVHRLGDDYRHEAVFIGNLLCIARL